MCHVLSHFWLSVAPMDCHLLGSSVHWIFQARILEWISISYSRESSLWVIKPESPELHCRWTLYLLNHWRSPKVRWSSKSDGPNRQRIIDQEAPELALQLTPKEPRMTLDIRRKPVKSLVNLVNTGATYLVTNNTSDKLCHKICEPLGSKLDEYILTHSFPYVP